MEGFDAKLLRTEEGRKAYYQYDMSRPSTLVHHQEPHLDLRFNKELLDRYGVDVHGDQVIRIAWAGSLPAVKFREDENGETHPYNGRKYAFMRRRFCTGYTYTDREGKRVTSTNLKQIPQGVPVFEKIEWDDLGIMKFVIEMKFTAETLIDQNYYPPPGSDEYKEWCMKDGKRYRTEPDPKGEYRLVHYIEQPGFFHNTAAGYRDVTSHDLEQIHKIISTSLNETEEEFVKRKIAQAAELQAAIEQDEQLKLADTVSDSIVSAEKRIAGRKKLVFT